MTICIPGLVFAVAMAATASPASAQADDTLRTVVREAVVVTSTRAEASDPVTQVVIDTVALRRVMLGQDVQYVLEATAPSIIAYSESGTSFSNYGSFRMRGMDQTRVNVTLNGAPINDMVDQGVFFSNITDLTNGMQSIQVQRGVGTSQNGTASYAGSVNMQTPSLSGREASGLLQLTGGSFGLMRGSAEVFTGRTAQDVSIYAKVGSIATDGYRFNTSTTSASALVSAAWFGTDDVVKLTVTGGNTRNQLGFFAVPKPLTQQDPRTNINDSTDHDDFGQYLGQLEWSRILSPSTTLSAMAYYGGAGGDYFSGFRDTSGVLTQINYPLTNRHLGAMAIVNLDDRYTFGVHAYRFWRRNWEAVTPELESPYYDDRTTKTEVSAFAKASVAFDSFELFGDVQLRSVVMAFSPDARYVPQGTMIPDHSWLFINPLAGLRYHITEAASAYVSAGYTGREPTRFDLLGGTQINEANLDVLLNTDAVRPEYALDIEAGVNLRTSMFTLDATVFSMHFTDEIAPIGQYIEQQFVQLRKNVPTSRRQGLELGFTVGAEESPLVLSVMSTWMKAVIDEYAPENIGVDTVFTNVRPVLTPELMGSATLRWKPVQQFWIQGTVRYVSEQFLELSNQPTLVLDPYTVLDARVSWSFWNDHRISLAANNLLGEVYAANGATGYLGTDVVPTLFMQAPLNFVVSLELHL
ncbi:MAG: hypothetical protein EHM43_04865 [Ignavibacteriae bacterium]|nr:MAG: hypothetical protein EHM43_04865 [Ignavibacteriota bacterium]